MCKKASYQARALACLSGVLNVESKYLIFNAFEVSNFMYCPLVWYMYSVSDSKKVEKIQERALRYVLYDFNETYCNLLQRASKSTLYLSRLRILVIEIFNILNDMSSLYMMSLFIKKCNAYELRDFIPLIQPKFNTIAYGHNTIRYQGSKILNNLSNNLKMSNGYHRLRNQYRNGLDQIVTVVIVCSALWHIYNIIVYIIISFHS